MTLPLNRLQEFTHPADVSRFNMIEQQIRPWRVDDTAVLELLGRVKREHFVPEAFQALAFMDLQVPLVSEDSLQHHPDWCMVPPKIEARMLNDLKVQPHERVLEIGAGSGYMAALLGGLGREVISLEIEPELVRLAQGNLQKNQIANVQVLQANGATEVPAGGFDVIVVSGSVVEVPPLLLAALNEGGRLMACVGQEPVMRMQLVRKTNDQYAVTTPWDFNLPRLQGFPEPSGFEF
ncbi:protein-L-isoaspartate O-methyltransferase [Corticibacter populi]|uniref:Protein-L-isoaspartate O-methyltransferase n=1 Tax=Corticibacter populi TaxID=1550736 RepID=A0A3M6QK56_9BURK|nr:protein-L-isoaspartate O-methyltransferase [Corticibacter populi]RMX03480.1 protein-L-isoaspartate O-methyltransferase [Corticibacter populi]RZS29920.1 protein-L-isoaspartate(D-aspartate) O-methyltransferase [Corticibacter populi]